MSTGKSTEPSQRGQFLIAIGFFVLGVVITWLGVNDWRVLPPKDDVSSPDTHLKSAPPSAPDHAPGTAASAPSVPAMISTPPALPDPSLRLSIEPSAIDDYDAQSDLSFVARLTSNLDPGRVVLFELESAPGLTGFDYSIERRVQPDGESHATFRISPCNLLNINHPVAAAAEGDYVVVVQDKQTGTTTRSAMSLRLAPGADDFAEWRGGRCMVY